LDEHMSACVSDFGLARFLCTDHRFGGDNSSSLAGLKGSIGYIAPGEAKFLFCNFHL
jgi:hypothetical protein